MNFEDVLIERGIDHRAEGHHHCRDGWIQIDCPYCSPATGRFLMGYSLIHGNFSCWRCGTHQKSKTLQEITGLSWDDVNAIIKDGRSDYQPKQITRKLTIPKSVKDLLPQHIKYIKKRDFDPNVIEQIWGVRGIGIDPTYGWRIWIPVHYKKQIVSWTTRSIGKTKFRYKSAKQEWESLNHKHLLYGEDYCNHAVIVHEGPLDAWRTGPGAVALCGVAYTQHQVLKISKYPVRAICFDSSPDAQIRAEALANELKAFSGETYIVKIDAEDPAEMKLKEVQQLRKAFL